ncbi:MAG TPA: HU family DNA-binding protein [Caulobacteraceae bacterium]|nr:HU family DNA-binding protein [Caulobacteraceae bacterium]
MTKADLVTAIAEQAGLNRVQARDALDACLKTITEALRSGRDVRLVGFGVFTPVRRPAGPARNPRTGAAVRRAASVTARFHAGDALKKALS